MKLLSFEIDGQTRLGALLDGKVYDLNICYALFLMGMGQPNADIPISVIQKANIEMPSDMLDFLKLGEQGVLRAQKVLKRITEAKSGILPENVVFAVDDAKIKAPIARPGKILCLAGNYAEHIREAGRDVAGKEKMAPRVFMKPATCVIGHGDTIKIPKVGNKIDWEAEMGVVIGKQGKYIKADEAYEYIAGYTVVNDVSERELIIEADREPSEWNNFFDWLNGKWMDTFAPMGPCIVTKDEISDPQNLGIRLKVNDKIKQNSNTGNMIFNIAELVEFASRIMTLEPGDVIATGTPEGVGSSTGEFLKDGDLVEVEIDEIGILKNPVGSE